MLCLPPDLAQGSVDYLCFPPHWRRFTLHGTFAVKQFGLLALLEAGQAWYVHAKALPALEESLEIFGVPRSCVFIFHYQQTPAFLPDLHHQPLLTRAGSHSPRQWQSVQAAEMRPVSSN